MANTRVRIGFKPTAKGVLTYDVTAEAESPSEAAALLRDGLKEFKKIAIEEGFTLLEGGAE